MAWKLIKAATQDIISRAIGRHYAVSGFWAVDTLDARKHPSCQSSNETSISPWRREIIVCCFPARNMAPWTMSGRYGDMTASKWLLYQYLSRLNNGQFTTARPILASGRIKTFVLYFGMYTSVIIDIIEYTLKQKWRWDGHIPRMKDNRWTKRCTEWQPRRGKTSRGRPSRRWQDNITRENGTTWISKATNRGQWKALMEGYILQ